MLEMNFLSPRIQAIQKWKAYLLEDLQQQGIHQFDVVSQEFWFLKELQENSPLSQIIAGCEDSLMDGFLTPITNKSLSPKLTVDFFLDEMLDQIQLNHLRIAKLMAYKQKLKDHQLLLQDLTAVENLNPNPRLLMRRTREQETDYSVYVSDRPLQGLLEIELADLSASIEVKAIFADQVEETQRMRVAEVSSNLLIDVEPLELLKNQLYLELVISFTQAEVQLQLVFELSLESKLLEILMAELTRSIGEIEAQITEKEKLNNQLLKPFIKQVIKYDRQTGLYCENKARDSCCQVF